MKNSEDQNDNWLFLEHSECIRNPLIEYRKRWKIETCFKHLKTGGFNLENSKIKSPKRFFNLAFIVAITMAMVIAKASLETVKKIKSDGYPVTSVFRDGLRKFEKELRKLANSDLFSRNPPMQPS